MGIEIQPYVGPRPFEQKDQAIFFGRDREARDLLSLVIAHNVVLIYAQSGAGKTSLLNAKLIPSLEEKRFEVLPVARVRGIITEKIKTERVSNVYIFNTLMNWAEGKYEVEQLETMTLADFLKEREHNTDEDGFPLPRAVIFDQFEELFSLYQDCWKDRAGFFEQVSAALEEDPLLRIVFAIREDYIAQLDPYAPFLPEKLRTRFHMERLRKEAALLAVTKPLNVLGVTERSFAEGVAEKLVENLLKIRVETPQGQTVEVEGEFIEAVQLQVVCQSLWQQLPLNERQITLQHLKTYGNVEQVLSRFYDDDVRTAANNAHVDELRLRKWCEEVLITSMGTRGMVYREPKLTGGIPNAAIDILEDKRLIRKEMRAGARWYELTHDSFIKPIKTSNERWRQRRMEKRIEKAKIASIAIVVFIALIVFFGILPQMQPSPISPRLEVFPDPPSFYFNDMSAGETASRNFSISNSGTGNLTWNISADSPWITLNPTSGINSGDVTVSINSADLNPGSYAGNITLNTNSGTKIGGINVTIYSSASLGSQMTDFVGTWLNVDPNTRRIPKIEVSKSENNLVVQGYGACTPTYCDWGTISVPFQGNPVTAIYKFSFKTDTLTMTLSPGGKMHVNSNNVFTDGSNRDYIADDFFTKQQRLVAPTQLSPANDSVFSKYPRTMTLQWSAVTGAKSYTIEIDCYHCCQIDKWCTDIGQTGSIVPNITTTSYTFDFVGAQLGRWRVWAVDTSSQESPKSGWWIFKYTR